MELVGGFFLFVMGGIMLIKPTLMWKIAESWKTKQMQSLQNRLKY